VFQKPAFAVGFDTVGGNTAPIYSPSSLTRTRGMRKGKSEPVENPMLPI
jgi:hypothetical protein